MAKKVNQAQADLERAMEIAVKTPAKESMPEDLLKLRDEDLDSVVNGNKGETVDHQPESEHKRQEFSKLAHLFGHRKRGCQARFHKEYLELCADVMTSWVADRASLAQEVEKVAKSNQALAQTLFQRKRALAEETGKGILRTVFTRWKDELNRIVTELGGHPQDDGNVVFPDGSIAKMPRGLYIEPEYLAKFE